MSEGSVTPRFGRHLADVSVSFYVGGRLDVSGKGPRVVCELLAASASGCYHCGNGDLWVWGNDKMPSYQVSIIDCPAAWEPVALDDVPAESSRPLEVLVSSDDLFSAVRQAIEFNEKTQQGDRSRWAVVVEPGTVGRKWRNARLCTPLSYKVASIWWPCGWEPDSPLDVPNCVWKSQGDVEDQRLTYPQALATVRGLNSQGMAYANTLWYVIIAVENEPVSQAVAYDAAGTETTVEVRRLHVVRPKEGGGRGDCSHCPAHSFRCAQEDWITLEQDLRDTRTRVLPRTS